VGAAVSLLVAAAFAARLPPAVWAENKFLDTAFRLRKPIRESDLILNVDQVDNDIRRVGNPNRSHYAQALTALVRLGARQVVFDVEFKAHLQPADAFDPNSGAAILADAKDREFRGALARSPHVLMGYHFDHQDTLGPLRPRFEALKRAFEGDLSRGAEEVARRAGIPRDLLEPELENVRHHAALALVSERLEREPDLPFAKLKELVPSGSSADLALLQHAYGLARVTRRLEAGLIPVRVEGGRPPLPRAFSLTPPLPPFAERAPAGGFVNAEADPDGVLRRPWAALPWRDRFHLYLGLCAGVRGLLEAPEDAAEIVVRPREIEVQVRRAGEGAVRRSVRLPLDGEGRLLVNWAGNFRRNRREPQPERQYFRHVPFLQPVNFYRQRYELLDGNVRRLIGEVTAERGEPFLPDYVKLSDQMNEILAGRVLVRPEEFRALEDRMDGMRRNVIEEWRSEVAETERGIAAETRDRLRKRMEEYREKRKAELAGLLAPYELEAQLRGLVEGRLCLIGAAYTGSGDLHSTPLGVGVPGVDVHTNVANMVLTGQAIREAPAGVSFAAVAAAGLLVSAAVTYGSAAVSASATLLVMAVTAAVYGLLFNGPMILTSGAGPWAAALCSFAGTTAFKELVTQRSKRKLQRALETKTSPELVEILLEHPELLSKPRKMTGTFFFSDVKAFTSISEKMAAEVLFPFINRYLDRMTQALKRHQAYLDKYVGDGIMALFGIPVPSPTHARDACRAALECQEHLRGLNAEFQAFGLPQVRSRIGIHSGEVSAGYVGASDRSDYTVLGDNVNLASRLEGANKEYDTAVLISEATYELVAGQFVTRELDRIRVVGKRNAVRIFELLAPAGSPPPFDPRFLEAYEAALRLFQERRWPEAGEAFERALAVKPGDKPCQIYVARAGAFASDPPPPDWEGVFELTSK
jgi:adenylate cyclase